MSRPLIHFYGQVIGVSEMDPVIIQLDDNLTDQATKRMLQNVVDRKRKFEALKKKHYWTTITA